MSGFHSEGFPIYQTSTARAANPGFFKHLATTQPGETRAILGHLIADQRAQISYMIVRVSHRSPRVAQHMQTVHMGMRGYMRAPRTVYNTTHSTYVVAKQHWRDGRVEAISTHDTPEQARAAFKILTGRSVNGKHSTVRDGEPLSFGQMLED
jgi:hypothetical protein